MDSTSFPGQRDAQPQSAEPQTTARPGHAADTRTSATTGRPTDATTASPAHAAEVSAQQRPAQQRPALPQFIRTAAPALWVVGILCGAFWLYKGIDHALDAYLLDVGVFRDAGRAFLDNKDLYSDDFPTRSGFRFIYPPFAAMLFAPLVWVDEVTMEVIWTVATAVAVFGVIAMAVYRAGLGTRGRFGTWWLWALSLTGFALALDPLRAHVMYGQINIFLILLITADVLGFTPRKIRGVGIGVAAGIKITPAAYAVIFLVRKDWWSLGRSVLFFLATAVIGWALRAESSMFFWTSEFFNSDRGGAPLYPPNQAMTGLIARLGVDGDTAAAIMLPGFILFAALSVWGAWKLERAGRPVDSLLLVILGIVLASPLAVVHHWSGVVIALVLLFRPLNRVVFVCLVLAIVAHALGLHAFIYGELPEGTTHVPFEFPGYFLGNLQGLTGIFLFFALLVTSIRTPRAEVVSGASTH